MLENGSKTIKLLIGIQYLGLICLKNYPKYWIFKKYIKFYPTKNKTETQIRAAWSADEITLHRREHDKFSAFHGPTQQFSVGLFPGRWISAKARSTPIRLLPSRLPLMIRFIVSMKLKFDKNIRIQKHFQHYYYY